MLLLLCLCLTAGAFVQHHVTIQNSGNVALRGLTPSLADITCTPSLTDPLAAGGTTVCQGVHVVTQDEVEIGVSQLSVDVTAANIVPATGITFTQQVQLASVQLTAVASFSVVFAGASTCTAATRASEATSCGVVLQNNGTLKLYSVSLDSADCPVVPEPLLPGASVTCKASCAVLTYVY
jgi:hypothetical protein